MGCPRLTYHQNPSPLKVVYSRTEPRQKVVQGYLSVDPMSDEYPSLSDYMYVAGSPIILVDPDGQKIKVKGSIFFKIRVRSTLAFARVFSKDANHKIKALKSSNNIHTIQRRTKDGNAAASNSFGVDDSPKGYITTYLGRKFKGTGKGTGSTIYWDINSEKGGVDIDGNRERPKYIGLLHEIFHAFQMDRGEIKYNDKKGAMECEWDAVHFENQMRTQLGRLFFTRDIALRQWYGKTDVLRRDFDYQNNKPIVKPSKPRWELPKGV